MNPRLTYPLLLLALLMTAAAPPPHPKVNLAAVPIGRMDLPWWRNRFEATMKRDRLQPARLIWLGDSITQNWDKPDFQPIWQRFYGRLGAINLGFTGDTTASVLWRLDHGEVAGLNPQVVIVLIGANNLGLPHWGWRRTVPGIEAVVQSLHGRLPRAHIILLGILPSGRGPWVAANTRRINAALGLVYRGSREVTFLDVGRILMKNGHLNARLFLDPTLHPPEPALHPNPEGMERIAAAIEPTLLQVMGRNNQTNP